MLGRCVTFVVQHRANYYTVQLIHFAAHCTSTNTRPMHRRQSYKCFIFSLDLRDA